MANYYYLNERGEQTGPLTLEALRAQRLAPATMVWREGMADWTRADRLPELRTAASTGGGMSALRIVLIVFAAVGTLAFSLVGRFVSAFAASWLDVYPQIPAVVLLGIIVVALTAHVVFRRKKYLLEAALFALPFAIASVVTIVYYTSDYVGIYRNGRCVIEKRGGEGMLNRWGMEQIPCVYDNLTQADFGGGDAFYATLGGKEGVIDAYGNVIVPFEYDYLRRWLTTDMLLAERDDKYGLLQLDGTEVLPCEYDNITRWHRSGLYKIAQGDLDGLITPEGEVVLPCVYIFAKQDETGLTKINDGGWVDGNHKIRGGLWGVIDEKGEVILPCLFEEATINSEEIRTERDGIIAYYDLRGNFLYDLKDWH